MSTTLLEGLVLSGIGLSITFLALGLLIAVIKLLVLLFPDQTAGPVAQPEEPTREEETAALAVAVLLAQDEEKPERDPTLGSLLEK